MPVAAGAIPTARAGHRVKALPTISAAKLCLRVHPLAAGRRRSTNSHAITPAARHLLEKTDASPFDRDAKKSKLGNTIKARAILLPSIFKVTCQAPFCSRTGRFALLAVIVSPRQLIAFDYKQRDPRVNSAAIMVRRLLQATLFLVCDSGDVISALFK